MEINNTQIDVTALETKIKEFDESFCGEVRGLTLSQVKERLNLLAIQLEDSINSLKNNEEFKDLKEDLKEFKAPFLETQNKLKKKLQFIVAMSKEKQGV
jgi:hypothetical protein